MAPTSTGLDTIQGDDFPPSPSRDSHHGVLARLASVGATMTLYTYESFGSIA